MKKMFYIQVDKNGIIRDVIEFPYDGYMQVELDTPLPPGINGGWYRWNAEAGTYEEVPELRPQDPLEQRIADIEAAIAAILGGAF